MKLIDRLVNGCDEEQPLPATRGRALFFYGKENFGGLVRSSLAGALFFLPALFWLYALHYAEAGAVAALGATLPDYGQTLLLTERSFAFATYGVLTVLLAVFFVGLAGCFSFAKRVAMGENARFCHFWVGIRENGLRFFFFGLLFGLTLWVTQMNRLTYRGQKGFLPILSVTVAVVLFALVALLLMHCAAQTVIYRVSIRQLIKNATLLSFAYFFRGIGTLFLAGLPSVLVLLIPSPFQLLGLVVLAAFYTGYGSFFVVNTCLAVYDRTINPRLGDAYVGRGLARKSDAPCD